MGNMDNKPQTLSEKTTAFWNISLAWNRGQGPYQGMMTSEALKECNQLYSALGGHRLLTGKTTALRDAMIAGKKRGKKTKQPQNVLELKINAKAP